MSNPSGIRQPRRALKYSATLLVAALLAYAVFQFSQSWREAKSDQSGQLAAIADLSGVAVDTYFTQLEIGMRNLGEELPGTDKKPDLSRAFDLVSRFQALHTELDNVMLIRSDGQVLLTGKTRNSANLPTLANDPSFMEFRDELLRGTPFVIGRPVMGRIAKSWVIAARYAVTDQTGRLRYILSANLPANLLQRFWTDPASLKITALGLVRDDGYLVSRYPEPDAASADAMYGKPADAAMNEYLHANDLPQRGQVEMPDSNGKTQSIRALRRLQHYPVTLFVEMPMSEIRTAWRNDMHAPYLVMALLLACIFAIYGLTLHRRRVWSTTQRREELRQEFERAQKERSENEIFMFDAGTLQITYANDYALDNLGYSLEQLQKMDILSLHPKMGIKAFGALIEPLRRGEQAEITYQTEQSRADGSTYPVEVNVQLTAEGSVEGFVAIVNDITELRQSEENLRAFNSPVERRGGKRE